MDIKTGTAALSIIRQLLDPAVSTTPAINTPPQKPQFVKLPMEQPFKRTTPEEQGVPSAVISEFLEALRTDETLYPHSVMILRNGCVIAEASYGAHDHTVWHITYSECKSITGIAIGMLIDEGKLSLNDKIVDIFADRLNKLNKFTHMNITVRHLLTMTSGIVFNEAGSVTENNWVKCFFESFLASEPGKHFNYNSMNTYMLSAIVKTVSGHGLCEYLRPRLFEPLGIRNFYWEKCPMGIEKGGWGMYILPEDILKIGQLLLNGGVWNGKRLISQEWIDAATSAQAAAPKSIGDFNYGYQMWSGRNERSFLFNGMFGQNLMAFKDTGIIVAVTSGNNEFFQQSTLCPTIERCFGSKNAALSGEPLPKNTRDYSKLTAQIARLKGLVYRERRNIFDSFRSMDYMHGVDVFMTKLNGAIFDATEPKARSVGLYPLMTQTLQNNYTKGLRSIGFRYEGGALTVTIYENDQTFELPVGFDKTKYTDVYIHGEPEKIGVSGRLTHDEDDTPVLKICVSFIELASTRFIKLFFEGDRIVSKWAETPGMLFILSGLDLYAEKSKILEALVEKNDEELLRFRLSRMFEPELLLERRR